MRRLTILLAAVGALLLVPAASALAVTATINIEGEGAGEVVTANDPEFGGAGKGTPGIECSYEFPFVEGTCENTPDEPEPGLNYLFAQIIPAPGSEVAGVVLEEGISLNSCEIPAGTSCRLLSFGGENIRVTVVFEPGELTLYPLTVSKLGTGSGKVTSLPGGISCGATCSHEFEEGAKLTLHPEQGEGSVLSGWSGCDEVNGTNECLVTMNEAKSVTATFTSTGPTGPPLTLNIEEGSGTVVSNPAGLECTGSAPKACTTESIEEGTVTLTASPAPGYLFKSWKKCDSGGVNGRQCTINLNSAKEVGAKFVKSWNLDVSKAGSGTGKFQTAPGGVLCLYNCGSAEAAFKEGSVTIKQAPAKHNHFVQWLGDCTGSAETCTLNMNEDHSVEAEFAPDTQYTLSISKTGGGQASIKSSPSGLLCGYTCGSQTTSFYSGETVSIAVTLNKGTSSVEWTTSAGTCTGNALTCTVPMTAAKTLVAKLS